MHVVHVAVESDRVIVRLEGLRLAASGASLGEAMTRLTELVVQAEANAEARCLLINILGDTDLDEDDRVILDP